MFSLAVLVALLTAPLCGFTAVHALGLDLLLPSTAYLILHHAFADRLQQY